MVKINPFDSPPFEPELDELERLSNAALSLIERGRLADAEKVCLELRLLFPEQIDWIERTACLHEARGNVGQAVEHYRRCIDTIDTHSDDFDPESRDHYESAIRRLEPRVRR
jgi:hypothetical protein